MKKYTYSLLRCKNGGNVELDSCLAQNPKEATSILQRSCPVPLINDGYAKHVDVTFAVAEQFQSEINVG
jgi:hypothetical protein